MTTPILGLDELAASQSQPHVPLNAAIRALEVLSVLARVSDKDAVDPPGSPSEGDRYVLASGPLTGAWAGHQNDIAYYSGGWQFLSPETGWLAYVADEDAYYQYVAGSPAGWSLWSSGASGAVNAADVTYTQPGSPTPWPDATNVAEALDDAATRIEAVVDQVSQLLSVGIPYAQPGKPGAGAIYHVMIPHAITIPAGLSGTHGYAGTTSTGSASYSLKKNGGAAFGTIDFTSGNATPSLVAASATTFVAGDRLTITAPAVQDATLADVGFTLLAQRSLS